MSSTTKNNGAASSNSASTSSSSKKEKNEEQFELEQQFVLRFPSGEYADRLRELVESGDEKIRERLFIDLNPETRRGRVKFDDTIFKATLYDLPCITESYKTFDRKTMYKIADIAQILVCRLPGDLSSSDDDDEEALKRSSGAATSLSDGGNDKKKKDKDKEKKYQWPHGLTPPMKNVRKRRFRKVARQKTQDHDEIEKEVRRLFRADNEAVDVKWEIIEDDQEIEISKPIENDHPEDHDLFGGAVSESDEEDASHKGVNENTQNLSSVDRRFDIDGLFSEGMGEFSNIDTSQMQTIEEENSDALDWQHDEDLNREENNEANGLSVELQHRLEECQIRLDRLRADRAGMENQLAEMSNPALRSLLETRIDAIQSEIQNEQAKYEEMMNS